MREILALAALAVILLVLLLVLERPSAETPPDRYLFHLQGKMIERILITGRDEAVAAVRTDDGWMLETPWRMRGDFARWDELAETLAGLRYHRVLLEEAADLPAYGLEPPQTVVTFFDREANARKVEFGVPNPTGDYVYARRGQDPRIYLLDRALGEPFAAPAAALRENRAFPFDFRAVSGFKVEQPGGRFEFRRDDGEWRLRLPFAAPGASAAIQDWLFRISRWPVAEHLHHWDLSRARDLFGEPRCRLVIELAGGWTRTLEIGTPARAWGKPDTVPAFLPGPDVYFLVAAERAAELDIAYGQLLQPTLLAVDPTEIKGISVDSPAEHWSFFRTAQGEWRWVRQQLSVTLSASRITEYIEQLARLPVVRYLPPASDPKVYGLEESPRRIFLDQEHGLGTEFAFGQEGEGIIYVRRNDYPCILAVDLNRWRAVNFEPRDWILPAK
ncbi:MAG: DUF4340 domain-containing protein [Acidobacteria bacterium]|nr:DUF4340 domain-containing protein [Acidobacteriota bacterium]